MGSMVPSRASEKDPVWIQVDLKAPLVLRGTPYYAVMVAPADSGTSLRADIS